MKMVHVNLGSCGTCGKRLRATVTDIDFIDNLGHELSSVRVAEHCGQPGHNMYGAIFLRDEFDRTPPFETV